MNASRINLALLFCFGLSFSQMIAQEFVSSLHFQLRLMPDQSTWAVFVKPDKSITPGSHTTAGSGQVTIVAPMGFEFDNLTSYGGTWIANARVDSPVEAPGKSYISFGFLNDVPKIVLRANQETLLFTFMASGQFEGGLQLFDNQNDPFAAPNSYECNPGNDLGIIDFSTRSHLIHYTYAGNYPSQQESARPILVNNRAEGSTGMNDNRSNVITLEANLPAKTN